MTNSKSYLVTGGAGFLGSHLVEKLVNLGHEVVCMDNEFRGTIKNLKSISDKNLEIIKGDVRRIDDWPKKTFDGIFHLAAINGTPNFYSIPDLVLDVNIKGTINAIEYVIKNKIPYLSFASSPEAYGIPQKFPTPESEPLVVPDLENPRWSYGASKIIGDVYCVNLAKKYDFKCSILRYNNSYGPRDFGGHVIPDLIKKIKTSKELIVEGTGNETRSFCYVDDTIDATLLIEEKQNEQVGIFNVGNNTETKISELVDNLLKMMNSNISPKYVSKPNLGTNRRLPSLEKLYKLGFSNKVNLEDGLKKTIEWFSNNS